jgi:hypothetical protein
MNFFTFAQLDKVLAIMYGACVADRNRAVAGPGWHMQKATQNTADAVIGFADANFKDGMLSVKEFVGATTKIPQVGTMHVKRYFGPFHIVLF